MALEEMAVQAVRQGQEQHSVHLLGAAALLRRTMGAPVRLADRPAIAGALAAARASLGDRPFDEAWAAGHTRPVEHSVAQSVAGAEDGPAKPDQEGQHSGIDPGDTRAHASHPPS